MKAEFLVIGFATAFNFIIIMWKFKKERYQDAVTDIAVFLAIAYLFAGTIAGMSVGMIASFTVSLYLLISPPNFKF